MVEGGQSDGVIVLHDPLSRSPICSTSHSRTRVGSSCSFLTPLEFGHLLPFVFLWAEISALAP